MVGVIKSETSFRSADSENTKLSTDIKLFTWGLCMFLRVSAGIEFWTEVVEITVLYDAAFSKVSASFSVFKDTASCELELSNRCNLKCELADEDNGDPNKIDEVDKSKREFLLISMKDSPDSTLLVDENIGLSKDKTAIFVGGRNVNDEVEYMLSEFAPVEDITFCDNDDSNMVWVFKPVKDWTTLLDDEYNGIFDEDSWLGLDGCWAVVLAVVCNPRRSFPLIGKVKVIGVSLVVERKIPKKIRHHS